MKSLALPLGKTLHHAYLITGDIERNRILLNEALGDIFGKGFIVAANPDLLLTGSLNWGIADSRLLKEWMTRKPAAGSKCAIVAITSITREAQNALLKTLEEPVANTHFFILAPAASIFLPTIISRCFVIENERQQNRYREEAIEFVGKDISERNQIIKEVLAKNDEEKVGADFLNALLVAYWNAAPSTRNNKVAAGAEEILRALNLSTERGGSLRLLLEHLANVVPVI